MMLTTVHSLWMRSIIYQFEMQSKLLRVLQEGEVRPVGSNQTEKLNVRVIAASSSPLKRLVDENKFREDLIFPFICLSNLIFQI